MKLFFRNHKELIFGLFFIAILYLVIISLPDLFIPNIFIHRDISRAYDLLAGHLIWYGPELSNGGQTPGPFFYYLIAPSILAGGLTGYLNFMLLLFCAAVFLIWIQVKNHTDLFFATAIALLFIHGGFGLRGLRDAWNPCFLDFFWCILIYLSIELNSNEKPSEKLWLIFYLLIGLTGQIHVSSFFWYPLSFIILNKITLKRALIGFLIVISFQIPFIIWKIFYAIEGWQQPTFGGPLSHLKYLGNLASVEFQWTDLTVNFFKHHIRYRLSILFLLFFAIFILTIRKVEKIQIKLLALIAVAFILALPAILRGSLSHYIKPCFYFMGVFVIIGYRNLAAYKLKIALSVSVVVSYLLFVIVEILNGNFPDVFLMYSARMNLFWLISIASATLLFGVVLYCNQLRWVGSGLTVTLLTFFIYGYKYNSSIDNRIRLSGKTAQALTRNIFSETKWSTDEFKLRVLFFGSWPEESLLSFYDKKHSNKDTQDLENDNLGAVIIHVKILDKIKTLPTDESPKWYRWIQNGSFELIKSVNVDDYIIFYYRNKILNGVNSHNIGEHYTTFANYFAKHSKLPSYFAEVFKSEKVFLFYDKNLKSLTFHARSLSRFFTVGPSVFLKEPRLIYNCDGQIRSISIPDLGYPLEISRPFKNHGLKTSDIFLTPITVKNIDCVNFVPVELNSPLALKIIGPTYNFKIVDLKASFSLVEKWPIIFKYSE